MVPTDDFLDMPLFVPFGIELAGMLQRRDKPRSRVFLNLLRLGAASSYLRSNSFSFMWRSGVQAGTML